MKMDRTLNKTGKGKYALVLLRKIDGTPRSRPDLARAIMDNPAVLDFGMRESPSEFFVIRLKDKHAKAALLAYAESIKSDDKEFSNEVFEMAARSGTSHPHCKKPD